MWGWSASAGPRGGYLGWGNIIDSVVTPHASALAINLYPQEVVSNLRMLEKLGARKPYEYQGKMHEFGFRDSIDVCSGDVADGYLILDQAMLFLSLANFLEDGIVWKTFAKSGLVKNGLRLVKDLEVGGTARRKFLEDIQNLKPDKPLVNIGKIGDVCKITPGQSISADIRVINLTAGKWAGLRLESRVYQEGISGPLESDARVFELVDRAEQVIHTVSVPAKATKQATSILIQAWLYDSDGRLIGKDDRTFTVFEGLDLSGEWLFQTGDNTEWAGVNYTDKNWDRIDVPVVWEKQGYANYDGYGWYRKHFSVPDTIKKRWGKRALILRFGAIDDVDETYLNGRLLGITGTFPQKESAHCVTAYDKQREYRIPEGVLNYEKENIIAVRVYDEIGEGGIWKEPVEIVPAEKFQRRKVK